MLPVRSEEGIPPMASIVIASLTAVPLVLLVWDLARNNKPHDPFAGPARTPIS
jgi:hypothetical protein